MFNYADFATTVLGTCIMCGDGTGFMYDGKAYAHCKNCGQDVCTDKETCFRMLYGEYWCANCYKDRQ